MGNNFVNPFDEKLIGIPENIDITTNSVTSSQITAGTTYYVDGTAGSDNNPGTASAPFLTIDKALSMLGNVTDGFYNIQLSVNNTYTLTQSYNINVPLNIIGNWNPHGVSNPTNATLTSTVSTLVNNGITYAQTTYISISAPITFEAINLVTPVNNTGYSLFVINMGLINLIFPPIHGISYYLNNVGIFYSTVTINDFSLLDGSNWGGQAFNVNLNIFSPVTLNKSMTICTYSNDPFTVISNGFSITDNYSSTRNVYQQFGNGGVLIYDNQIWGGSANVGSLTVNSSATLTGTTAGTITYSQPQSGVAKKVVMYANGYENTTATAQTITYPTAFTNPAVITTNTTGMTLSTSTTALTLPTSMTAAASGVIIVEGI